MQPLDSRPEIYVDIFPRRVNRSGDLNFADVSLLPFSVDPVHVVVDRMLVVVEPRRTAVDSVRCSVDSAPFAVDAVPTSVDRVRGGVGAGKRAQV